MKLFNIVNSKLSQAQVGSNEIRTTINGLQVTIRFYFQNGEFKSLDAFIGWSERIIGKLLK